MKPIYKGFSLIELMVGLAILALVMAIGVPSIRNMIQNAQVRTAAESVMNGLQLARTEAVRRNSTVRFQLTTDIGAGCAISTAGNSWVVSLSDPTAACTTFATNVGVVGVIQSHSNTAGPKNAVIASDGQSTIFFNGLGRQASGVISTGLPATPNPTVIVTISITNPTGGTCVALGGPVRCMDVVVSPGGRVRMCDPTLGASDLQSCSHA